MTDLELAAEFPIPDRSQWEGAVEKVLRGRSFERVLVSSTRDGLDIQPLYTEAPASHTPVPCDAHRVESGWDVRQQHSAADPERCSREVLDELQRGVTSVELTPPTPRWTIDSLEKATAGVFLDLAPVTLAPHADVDAARSFASVIEKSGAAGSTRSWLGLDPIGEVVRGGFADTDDVVAVAASVVPSLPHTRTLTVDSTRYAEAGASEAQEIAWSIATGVAYLRSLERAGIDPAVGASTIGFRLSAGPEQFVTIAALRASRRLWARVLAASGVAASDHPQMQHAVTNRAMFSRRDPWVNMLRGTTAALAAGVGGADAVTVLPFDDAVGEPDRFARRVARNTQTLLIEESHLAKVIDPAGGAWFVESLTEQLSQAAWARFQAVEAAGGIAGMITDGTVADEIEAMWNQRLDRLSTRRDALTGVSEFPLLEEDTLEREARTEPIGFPVRRLAAPFETLRDAADRHTAETGDRPVVHIAALGDLATHTTRSTWTTNLLAVGGIAAVGAESDGSLSPLEAEARFSESGAAVAVLCSSDGVYAERAAASATALREAGAIRVILAGNPGDLRSELEQAGIDDFWYVGIDVVAALTRLHADLGL